MYADVVILLNFVMNFLILRCVRSISGCKARKGGIFIGSLLGGFYSLFMFERELNFLYTPIFKLAFTIMIIIISYNIKGNFIKLVT